MSDIPKSTETPAEQKGTTLEGSDLAALLNKEFRPKSDEAMNAVQTAVQTLAQQALSKSQLISGDAIRTIQSMIAEIDAKLTGQVNEILHHADFQKLEGSWRGLHYLINNTETDEMLKIRVMNISKKDLGKTLKRFKGVAWDQSPLFKRVYEEEYGQFGGEPIGAMVGDYYFNQTSTRCRIARRNIQDCGGGARAVYCRSRPEPSADGFVAGTG
jgi:type VI secretion system protein ImpC